MRVGPILPSQLPQNPIIHKEPQNHSTLGDFQLEEYFSGTKAYFITLFISAAFISVNLEYQVINE